MGESLCHHWGREGHALWLGRGASFFLLTRAGEVFVSKEGCWYDGRILRRGDVAFIWGRPNLIGQVGIMLIASRFGFGVQKGTKCGTKP